MRQRREVTELGASDEQPISGRQPSLKPRPHAHHDDIGPGILPILCLVVPACVLFLVWGNWTSAGTGDVLSLSHIAVAVFSLLLLLNVGVRKLLPGWAVSRGNLIAAFSVVAICGGIMGNLWTWGSSIAQVVAYPAWVAGYSDRYADFVLPYLPEWLVPTNRQALAGFFAGESSPYSRSVLLAWLQPALWWTAWVSVTLLVALCLGVLVRRRWADEERLAFPIAALPLSMTDPEGGLYRSRLFWIGVVTASGVVAVNTLSRLVPSVPAIPTGVELSFRIVNNRPWDGLRCTNLQWPLGFFGLAYLMPLDLAFSLVVFNLFWRGVYVFARAEGWLINPWDAGFPYGDQQVIGGYVAVVVSVLWLDRRYILQVLRKAAGLASQVHDQREAFTYRTALLGLLLGVAFLWWWYIRCGMNWTVAGAFLVLLLTMLVAIMRVRAQVGPPSHWMYGTMPEFVITQYPGLRALGPQTLGILAIMRPFMGEQNGNPAPIQLEALYMASRTGISSRRMGLVLLGSVPVVVLVYFWATVHIGYRLGIEAKANLEVTRYAEAVYGKLDGWLQLAGGPNWSAIGAIGVGAIVTLVLMYLKLSYPLWPIHPIAFPMGMSYAIDYMLPPIFLTWLAKLLLLRYGGLRAHRTALPLFLGLLVGDFTATVVSLMILRSLGIYVG